MSNRSFYDEWQYRVVPAIIATAVIDYTLGGDLTMKLTVAFPGGGRNQTVHLKGYNDQMPSAEDFERQLESLFTALGVNSISELNERACEAYLLDEGCDDGGPMRVNGFGRRDGTAGFLFGRNAHVLLPEYLAPAVSSPASSAV